MEHKFWLQKYMVNFQGVAYGAQIRFGNIHGKVLLIKYLL